MSKKKHKEDVFYALLQDLSASLVSSAETYVAIVSDYPASKDKIPAMKEAELACDKQVRGIMEECTRSFITPFDREDIAAAAHNMDDVIDCMEGISARLDLFAVDEMRPAAIELANLTLDATHELQSLFQHLPNYKNDSAVLKSVVKVSKIEDKGDVTYRAALGTLYHEETDPIAIIKWTGLLDKMEDALDACEATSNVIHGVIVKNA